MTSIDDLEATADLHCVQQAIDLDLEPVGTAQPLAGLVLVERPLPWPPDVSEDPVLAPAVEAGIHNENGPVRPFAVVPAEADSGLPRAQHGKVTVTSYRNPEPAPAPFEKRTYRVAANWAGELARILAAGEEPDEPVLEDGSDRDELLICTHGARDRCCGSLGTTLYRSVSARWSHLDVHRISHTGGHRFAPTAILLPSGTVWGHLDDEVLDAIVNRTVPFVEVIAHFRGSAVMPSRASQVAEAAVAARVGWGLFDAPRQAVVLAEPEPDRPGRFEIHFADRSWAVTVEHNGVTRQPMCMSPLDQTTKTDPRFAVTTLEQL
jgi:hypothetical protein